MSSITEEDLAAMLGSKPNYRTFLMEINAVATEPALITAVNRALDGLRVEKEHANVLRGVQRHGRLASSTDGMLDHRGVSYEALARL